MASGGHSSSWCVDLSLSRPLLLRSTGSRRAGSVLVAHGPSCSTACGILPDQGSNPCPLHWQADSQPLRHQGSPSPLLRSHLFSQKYPSVPPISFLDDFVGEENIFFLYPPKFSARAPVTKDRLTREKPPKLFNISFTWRGTLHKEVGLEEVVKLEHFWICWRVGSCGKCDRTIKGMS